MIRPLAAVLALFSAASAPAGPAPMIVAAGNQPEYTQVIKDVSELSGLTWAKEDLYYGVSDSQPGIFPLRLTIDPESGMLTSVRREADIPVTTGMTDFEDIAYDTAKNRLFVSTERTPSVTCFSLKGGKPLTSPVLPEIYQKARFNKAMEALTREPATGKLWTANEDTLTPDGEPSGAQHGGVVRLQEFEASGKPARQFVWQTDAPNSKLGGGGTGLTGLCALPGGELIVMERVVTNLHLETRLYLAMIGAATDVSEIASLANAKYTPVQKRLLFSKNTGITNYEGIAAGPVLKDGSRSLILVADNGIGDRHVFMALKVAASAAK